MPEDTATLDSYEQLIEAIRLAGRAQEAFDLYWHGLGAYKHLGWKLGEYARGYRILRGFLPPSGNPKGFGDGLTETWQSVGLSDLSLMALCLGRLREAVDIRREDDARTRALADPRGISVGLELTCQVAVDLGRLGEALAAARESLVEAERAKDDEQRVYSLSWCATTQHLLGKVAAARNHFVDATVLEGEPMMPSLRGRQHARHHLDLGNIAACQEIAEAGLSVSQQEA